MKERLRGGGEGGGHHCTTMLSDVLVSLVSPLSSPLLSSPLSPFYNRWEITAENGALNFPHFVPITVRRSPRALTRHLAGWPGAAAAFEKEATNGIQVDSNTLLNRLISPLVQREEPPTGSRLVFP